uniref:Integrase, catalytic region, zinc finger, CCHC-type, peptidase aspartic, catalytic n=1 Tax=Tanacetum cinerariifolium TaxID=118510 RepID=A0A6L2JY28_TANCI|nr:hypothetical protein [Tanacetum cinerariifolium]
MQNLGDISNPTTALDMALEFMSKEFQLNNTTPTNNNQRSSSNPSNMPIAQPGMNMDQDRHMLMVKDNIVENMNGLSVVSENANQYGNENVETSSAEVKPRKRDAAYLQQQLQITQEEEAAIQSTQKEFKFMAAADAYEETERVKANCILENNLQQASTSGTQSDKAPVYDTDGLAGVHLFENCYDNNIFNMFTQEEQYPKLLEPILEPHQVPQNDSNVIFEVSSVEQEFLKEAAKFVRDFKSLAKEADKSIAKQKALELEIERLLRAVVSQDIIFPKVGETHALLKPVTSNSVPTLTESKVVKNNNVISPGIFRINPFKAFRVDNFVPNKPVKASVRKKPITVSQPSVITKNDENSKTNGFSPKDVKSTTKARRPQPKNNPKSDKVPFKSKSSCLSNNLEKIEENNRNSVLRIKNICHLHEEYNNMIPSACTPVLPRPKSYKAVKVRYIHSIIQPELEDLPRNIPLDRVEVLGMIKKRSKSENYEIVPTEMALVLEQTQQGTSHEVSKHCVLSSEDLAFCLQKILHFVFRRSCVLSSEDLVFCLQRSCVLLWKHCVLSLKILRFVSVALRFVRNNLLRFVQIAFCPRPFIAGPYKATTILVQAVAATDDSLAIPEHTTVETLMNMSPKNKAHFQAEKESIHLILTGIEDEIYSSVDACQTAQEIETMESYYTRFYKLPEWSRFVTIVKQQHKLNEVSYHKLFDILKQYQKEVNELRAKRLARNTNPLALVATAQANQDPYYQTSKSHKSHAPSSKPSIPTRSHTTTRYKGKEIAKPITPLSEIAFKEDNDPEQAQRDKDMQKNLALIAKYFKKIYKPTNNNLRTSSNSRNKNVDTTPWENVGSPVVQQSGIQYFNYMDEEIDEKELEAHYSYMAKIQEVPTADSGTDYEPLEQVQIKARYNMFANDLQHSKQSESVSNTCLVETNDSKVIPDSPDMCNDDIQNEPNDVESNDERVVLANLIANLKLDVDENKKIQKQLKKANTTLAQELKECKTILAETSNALRESISVWDSCLVALQNKQTEFEKYKAFNDHTIDYDKLKCKLNETLRQLAQKDIEIKQGLKSKAYEISVVKEKHDELIKQSLLTKSHYEGLIKQKTKVIIDLKHREEHDIDKMLSMEKQLKFLNEVVYKRSQSIQTIHMMAPKVPTYNGRPTFANPIYLKQAQSKIPCLYALPYDQSTHANSLIPDAEETLALKRESRSKLNKDLVRPYDYTTLNSLYENFKPPKQEFEIQLAHANEIRKKMWYQFRAPTAQDIEILIQTCLMPIAIKTQNDSFLFVHELKQEMHADLKDVESLEKEIDELEPDKAEFSNMYDMILQECVSKDVMCSYILSLSDLDALDELQCLYLHKVKECDYLAQKLSKQTESVSKEVKHDTVWNEKASNVFRKEREQYIKIQDLNAKLQDKNIAISELKKLSEKGKGKFEDTKFDKPSVVRQPNAQRIPKPSVLGFITSKASITISSHLVNFVMRIQRLLSGNLHVLLEIFKAFSSQLRLHQSAFKEGCRDWPTKVEIYQGSTMFFL